MCDSYIGLDQYYKIDLMQINGVISGQKREHRPQRPAKKQQQPAKPSIYADQTQDDDEYFSIYEKMQEEMVDELLDDEPSVKAQPKGKDEVKKPEMHQQITSVINGLLDDDEDIFGTNALVDEDEDAFDEDYEQMIEKDLDNWF